MTKVKKIVSAIALALIVLLSSLLLLACGKKATSEDCYKLFESSISTYKSNTDLFESGSIYGLSTNFNLKNLKSKDSSGNLIDDSQDYRAFVAYGLNYIETSYSKLEGLDVSFNFATINKQVEEMNNAYNDVESEFTSLKDLNSSASYIVYNGHVARYKNAVKNFIIEIFDSATALGAYLVEEFGDGIGSSSATSSTFNSFVDYHKLLICNDYKNYLIKSAEGQSLNQQEFASVQAQFKSYCLHALGQTKVTLSTEQAEETKLLLSTVNGDRENVSVSLEKFSINDYFTTYQQDLSAYAKTNKDAYVYYNNIYSYFGDDGVLAKLYTYLISL